VSDNNPPALSKEKKGKRIDNDSADQEDWGYGLQGLDYGRRGYKNE